ncbi:MAG: AbrB/MazE/SpoVT family DNA-binding domain-containing protein [Lachnospiraceae bacterium]|nr:AbrB/MazE/SpoVT family DNA-binding domain-containing protein [Lachnospiraceae bacterium]
MPVAIMKGSVPMEMKKVSISAKRQITIPQKFFTMLGFDTEAECMVRGNELVIRPTKTNSGGEFAEQILADLIAQGYSGDDLLARFKIAQKEVRPAVEEMLAEAEQVAGSKSEFATYEDVFGAEEEE